MHFWHRRNWKQCIFAMNYSKINWKITSNEQICSDWKSFETSHETIFFAHCFWRNMVMAFLNFSSDFLAMICFFMLLSVAVMTSQIVAREIQRWEKCIEGKNHGWIQKRVDFSLALFVKIKTKCSSGRKLIKMSIHTKIHDGLQNAHHFTAPKFINWNISKLMTDLQQLELKWKVSCKESKCEIAHVINSTQSLLIPEWFEPYVVENLKNTCWICLLVKPFLLSIWSSKWDLWVCTLLWTMNFCIFKQNWIYQNL